jgi:hypothetical protein
LRACVLASAAVVGIDVDHAGSGGTAFGQGRRTAEAELMTFWSVM